MQKPKRNVTKDGNIKTITRTTRSGDTKIKTVNNDTEMVNIVKKDKAGNVLKDKTRSKVFVRDTDDDTWGGDEGPGSAMKRGGSVIKGSTLRRQASTSGLRTSRKFK